MPGIFFGVFREIKFAQEIGVVLQSFGIFKLGHFFVMGEGREIP
ncbi:MAG: hypothetical protein ACJAQT_001027 [Akkermansiaceae bacterium]|jgi:hypothetical protein